MMSKSYLPYLLLCTELEATFKPDNWDKRILVHFKYYPDLASVPERISDSKMGQVTIPKFFFIVFFSPFSFI